MGEYPSIANLYASNGVQGKGIARGQAYGFGLAEFDQIGKWLVTEKIDGMNIRVIFETEPSSLDPQPIVRFAGRSDNAAIHPQLFQHLQEHFHAKKLWDVFKVEHRDGEDDECSRWECPNVTLFGEGFGPGIQKAGVAYGGEKRFILIDVLVGDRWWLSWDNVVDVAAKLGVPTVPVLARGVSLQTAKMFVRTSELLEVGSEHIEGIVLRTDPYLFNSRGHRIVAKYKVRDLTAEDEEELGDVRVEPMFDLNKELQFDLF